MKRVLTFGLILGFSFSIWGQPEDISTLAPLSGWKPTPISELFNDLGRYMTWARIPRDDAEKLRMIMEVLQPDSNNPISAEEFDHIVVDAHHIPGPYYTEDITDLPEYHQNDQFGINRIIIPEVTALVDEGAVSLEDQSETVETLIKLLHKAKQTLIEPDQYLEDKLTPIHLNLLAAQLIKICIFKDPFSPAYDPYRKRNRRLNEIAFFLQEPDLSLDQQIKRSLRSFEILKRLQTEYLFSAPPELIAEEQREKMHSFDNTEFAIDAFEHFEKLLVNASSGKTISVFLDDNGELVFILRMVQDLMLKNDHLNFVLIPKSGQFREDASQRDLNEALDNLFFKELKAFAANGRLEIVSEGPYIGGVDLSKISHELYEVIQRTDAVIAVGESIFPSLSGFNRDTFHLFSVNSHESTTVSGLTKGENVFAFVPAGTKYLDAYASKNNRHHMYTDHNGHSTVIPVAKNNLLKAVDQTENRISSAYIDVIAEYERVGVLVKSFVSKTAQGRNIPFQDYQQENPHVDWWCLVGGKVIEYLRTDRGWSFTQSVDWISQPDHIAHLWNEFERMSHCPVCSQSLYESSSYFFGFMEIQTCSSCSHQFQNPKMPLPYSLTSFPLVPPPSILKKFGSNPHKEEQTVLTLVQLLEKRRLWRPGTSLVEVGFGNGKIMTGLHAKQYPGTLFGVDTNAPSVQAVKERAKKEGVDPQMFFPGTIEDAFQEGYLDYDSVDIFVFNKVVEHIFDINDLLGDLHKYLKSNGIIIFLEVPNHGEGAIGDLILRKNQYYYFPDHAHFFAGDTLKLLAEQTGYTSGVLDINRRYFPDLINLNSYMWELSLNGWIPFPIWSDKGIEIDEEGLLVRLKSMDHLIPENIETYGDFLDWFYTVPAQHHQLLNVVFEKVTPSKKNTFPQQGMKTAA